MCGVLVTTRVGYNGPQLTSSWHHVAVIPVVMAHSCPFWTVEYLQIGGKWPKLHILIVKHHMTLNHAIKRYSESIWQPAYPTTERRTQFNVLFTSLRAMCHLVVPVWHTSQPHMVLLREIVQSQMTPVGTKTASLEDDKMSEKVKFGAFKK